MFIPDSRVNVEEGPKIGKVQEFAIRRSQLWQCDHLIEL